MKENHLHASSPELWKIANGMRKLTREGRILAPLFVCSFVCLFVCLSVRLFPKCCITPRWLVSKTCSVQ